VSRCEDYGHSFEIIQDGGGRHVEFVRIENSAIRHRPSPKNPTIKTKHEVDQMTGCGYMAIGGRHLGFVRTGNSAIRSAVPECPKTSPYNQT